MKTLFNLSLTLLAVGLVLLSSSCDPECADGKILSDPMDVTFPNVYWEVTQFTMTPDGPISSIRIIDADVDTVYFSDNEEVTVTLVASDPESGIFNIDVTGGFGVTCTGPGGAIAYSGLFPATPDSYPLEMNCAEVEVKHEDIFIDGPNLCNIANNPIVSQAGYQLQGFADNHAGLIRLKELYVILGGGGS